MDQYSVKNIKGKIIDNIWKRYKDIPVSTRGYMCIDNIKCNSLLFIGINPSFPQKEKNKSDNIFYDLLVHSNHYKQYYRKFEDLSDNIEMPWSHFDLLYYRETKQKTFDELIQAQIGKDFVWEQLMVSKDVIEAVKPKILVVSNTLARRLMGFEKNGNIDVWLGYDFRFDDEIGTHRINNGPLIDTPVFFTSMLSGQRALDLGSFERLEWHIKFVASKIKQQ